MIAALLLLVVLGYPSIQPVEANTGCPESTSSFGSQTFVGACTVTSPTTWENGVLTIAGDVVVNAPLTLRNLVIAFDPIFDGEHEFVISATLDMQGGGIQSTNSNQWRAQSFSGSITIRDGTFSQGTWDLSNSPTLLENNQFVNADARRTFDRQHMWIGPNSTVRHNTFTGIRVDDGAVMVSYRNWGNILFFANTIGYECMAPASLSNCMGIEVISSQDKTTAVAPFPAVEIAWNNFTFDSIAANTDSNAVDIEFSDRVYVHNNTMRVVPATQFDALTEFLLAGGVTDSVFENNTGFGKAEPGTVYTYCFFQFIYRNSNNIWQYNTCDDLDRMAIFSGTGSTVMAHNTMTNVSSAGFWICHICAGGSSSAGANLLLYDNSFTYQPGADLIWNDIATVDNNTYILNGNGQATQWGEGTGPPDHTVPGDGNWLYHAQTSIEALRFANASGGDRRVTMTADGGNEYGDTYTDFGATDNAALTISGTIDRRGSANANDDGSGTFLWELGRAVTALDVLATGVVTFTVESYFADTAYGVSVDGSPALSFNTNAAGDGSFLINFASQHNVRILGVGDAPPDAPPTASFVFSPSAPFAGENVAFDASGSSDDNGIVTYDWDLGNGDVRQGQVITYAFPSEGDYNVTLTVRDGAGNSDSAVAPIQVATPPPQSDQTPPVQVTDLEAVAVNSVYIVLQWRAPGDDGALGQADAYDVRFSTTGPLDGANFVNAAVVPVTVPAPTSPGGIERLNVTGLAQSTAYWFALRTADEVPNWSPISNVVNATTLQSATNVDDTPPTVIVTLEDQNGVISGTVLVVVEASDDTGVEEVVISLDGNLMATLHTSPYRWAWATATTAPGPHTVRAEAADPAGNIGSDELTAIVLPPGISPESLSRPTVQGFAHDPSEGRFDIQFSKPMDRFSVETALSIAPRIAYQSSWSTDSSLTVSLREASQPDVAYTLSIVGSAADTEGVTLNRTFTFGFNGAAASADSGLVPNIWLPFSLLLTVGLIAVTGLHLWSRRGTVVMRSNLKQLATRLEQLNHLSQERIYRELADLESLVSKSAPAAEGRSPLLSRAR